MRRDPYSAVVGVLQFEVVQARLESEYNVETRLQRSPHSLARWVEGPEEQIELLPWRYGLVRRKIGMVRWSACSIQSMN